MGTVVSQEKSQENNNKLPSLHDVRQFELQKSKREYLRIKNHCLKVIQEDPIFPKQIFFDNDTQHWTRLVDEWNQTPDFCAKITDMEGMPHHRPCYMLTIDRKV